MSYYQPPIVKWDPGGLFQGVSITRQLEDGKKYVWRIPYNGVVTQAMAADILGVRSDGGQQLGEFGALATH